MNLDSAKKLFSYLLVTEWGVMNDEEKKNYKMLVEWVQDNLFRLQRFINLNPTQSTPDVVRECERWDRLYELLQHIRRYD